MRGCNNLQTQDSSGWCLEQRSQGSCAYNDTVRLQASPARYTHGLVHPHTQLSPSQAIKCSRPCLATKIAISIRTKLTLHCASSDGVCAPSKLLCELWVEGCGQQLFGAHSYCNRLSTLRHRLLLCGESASRRSGASRKHREVRSDCKKASETIQREAYRRADDICNLTALPFLKHARLKWWCP